MAHAPCDKEWMTGWYVDCVDANVRYTKSVLINITKHRRLYTLDCVCPEGVGIIVLDSMCI